MISVAFPHQKQRPPVLGRQTAPVEVEHGGPIVDVG